MRDLFHFIQKNIHWFLFVLLIVLSIFLIIKSHQFQRSKYLLVTQEVTASVYSVTNMVQFYMNLKAINTDLLNRIAELETERYAYQNALEQLSDTLQTGKIQIDSLNTLVYQLIPARVVYNSVSKLENYMMLNKGSLDGIEADMGVLSTAGIVGVVRSTSPNSSLVIPVLNPKFRLSCMVERNHYFGPLVWDGKDPRYTYLTELPRHVDFEVGDTILTSFYSGIFPPGLPVGKVVDFQKQRDDNYTSLQVELFANFHTLNEVMVIVNNRQKEQNDLLNTVAQ